MPYSRIVLSSAFSGEAFQLMPLGIRWTRSVWLSATFHFLLLGLVAHAFLSVSAKPFPQISTLSVRIISQGMGFSAPQSSDSSKKFPAITATPPVLSLEHQNESLQSQVKPTAVETPPGPFSGSRRGPFNLGMGAPSFSYGQRKSAQDAERYFRDLALARQSVEIFLRDLTNSAKTADFSGRCRLSRNLIACDFEVGSEKDRLSSFWEFFSKQYPLIESVEIMKNGRLWVLIDLVDAP